jgi:hypothetical protein
MSEVIKAAYLADIADAGTGRQHLDQIKREAEDAWRYYMRLSKPELDEVLAAIKTRLRELTKPPAAKDRQKTMF